MRREQLIAALLTVLLFGTEMVHAAHACARLPHGGAPESGAPRDSAAHPDCGHRQASVCCDPAFQAAPLRRADAAEGPATSPVTSAAPPNSIDPSASSDEAPTLRATRSPPPRAGSPAYLALRSLRL
ncbi:MAG: hypothetical protein ABW298_09410 [Candidatus Binatia bacterium]